VEKILLIESSASVCSIAISEGDKLLKLSEFEKANSHSVVLAPMIRDLLKELDLQINQLDAVAISAGPGSYTGLRIGTATAKGICYASKLPLIAVSTLEAMASFHQMSHPGFDFYIPMFDARRMEVYTGAWSKNGKRVMNQQAIVLDSNPYVKLQESGSCLFMGSGVEKALDLLDHKGSKYEIQARPSAEHLLKIAHNSFITNVFEDVAYFEPAYLKAFWTPSPPPGLKHST
jgi:tRNA threonylcarbamoyladenosine biosynthesis protein TsaB